MVLLLPLVSQEVKHPIEQLAIESLAPKVVKRFLGYLEQQCGCSIVTRNIRLSALQALGRFIALHSPKRIAWRSEMCAVPFKKTSQPHVTSLDQAEMDTWLAGSPQSSHRARAAGLCVAAVPP